MCRFFLFDYIMNKYSLSLIIIITIIFIIINNYLNKTEHFINFYQYINDSFNHKIKENNKDITISRKFTNFHNLFLKNIYLSYSENKNQYKFYIFNYNHKLYMNVTVKKNKTIFDIYDEDNRKIGYLKNRFHNKYIIDLYKLYKNEYIYLIQNKYDQIKIYNNTEYNVYYLKKYKENNNKNNVKKFTLNLFDEEIGYINNDNKNYKFFIKKDYLEKINLFCYGLIIFISNNQQF